MSQETASILSPAGFIVDVNYAAPTLNTGSCVDQNNPYSVVPLLRGATIQARGTGGQKIRFGGIRGTIEIQATTGAGGMDQTLAILSPTTDSFSKQVVLALDGMNRPFVLIQDVLGNTVGETSPMGAAIDAGKVVVVRLSWDSETPIRAGKYAALKVMSQFISDAEWAAGTDPTSAWSSFYSAGLLVGLGSGVYSDFTGVIHKVQISPTVVL